MAEVKAAQSGGMKRVSRRSGDAAWSPDGASCIVSGIEIPKGKGISSGTWESDQKGVCQRIARQEAEVSGAFSASWLGLVGLTPGNLCWLADDPDLWSTRSTAITAADLLVPQGRPATRSPRMGPLRHLTITGDGKTCSRPRRCRRTLW